MSLIVDDAASGLTHDGTESVLGHAILFDRKTELHGELLAEVSCLSVHLPDVANLGTKVLTCTILEPMHVLDGLEETGLSGLELRTVERRHSIHVARIHETGIVGNGLSGHHMEIVGSSIRIHQLVEDTVGAILRIQDATIDHVLEIVSSPADIGVGLDLAVEVATPASICPVSLVDQGVEVGEYASGLGLLLFPHPLHGFDCLEPTGLLDVVDGLDKVCLNRIVPVGATLSRDLVKGLLKGIGLDLCHTGVQISDGYETIKVVLVGIHQPTCETLLIDSTRPVLEPVEHPLVVVVLTVANNTAKVLGCLHAIPLGGILTTGCNPVIQLRLPSHGLCVVQGTKTEPLRKLLAKLRRVGTVGLDPIGKFLNLIRGTIPKTTHLVRIADGAHDRAIAVLGEPDDRLQIRSGSIHTVLERNVTGSRQVTVAMGTELLKVSGCRDCILGSGTPRALEATRQCGDTSRESGCNACTDQDVVDPVVIQLRRTVDLLLIEVGRHVVRVTRLGSVHRVPEKVGGEGIRLVLLEEVRDPLGSAEAVDGSSCTYSRSGSCSDSGRCCRCSKRSDNQGINRDVVEHGRGRLRQTVGNEIGVGIVCLNPLPGLEDLRDVADSGAEVLNRGRGIAEILDQLLVATGSFIASGDEKTSGHLIDTVEVLLDLGAAVLNKLRVDCFIGAQYDVCDEALRSSECTEQPTSTPTLGGAVDGSVTEGGNERLLASIDKRGSRIDKIRRLSGNDWSPKPRKLLFDLRMRIPTVVRVVHVLALWGYLKIEHWGRRLFRIDLLPSLEVVLADGDPAERNAVR